MLIYYRAETETTLLCTLPVLQLLHFPMEARIESIAVQGTMKHGSIYRLTTIRPSIAKPCILDRTYGSRHTSGLDIVLNLIDLFFS
jgi:hypothetical protein